MKKHYFLLWLTMNKLFTITNHLINTVVFIGIEKQYLGSMTESENPPKRLI